MLDPGVGKIPCRRKWQLTPIFLARRIQWTEEPSGLQPMGLQSQTGLSRNVCTISRQQRGQRNMLKCSCIWNQQNPESKVPGSSTEQWKEYKALNVLQLKQDVWYMVYCRYLLLISLPSLVFHEHLSGSVWFKHSFYNYWDNITSINKLILESWC